MKLLNLLNAFMLGGLLLAAVACTKPADSTTTPVVPDSSCTLTGLYNTISGGRPQYCPVSYDASGRITRLPITDSANGGAITTDNISYSNTAHTIIHSLVYDSLNITYAVLTCFLNPATGYATSDSAVSMSGAVITNKYTYDTAGYLVRTIQKSPSGTDTTRFYYTNGNLTQEITKQGQSLPDTISST